MITIAGTTCFWLGLHNAHGRSVLTYGGRRGLKVYRSIADLRKGKKTLSVLAHIFSARL